MRLHRKSTTEGNCIFKTIDVYQALRNPNDDMTRDFLALEAVEQLPDDSDRRRIRW